MIITKTPFRVSFFGGGTDYPEWFREHGGCFLSTTIDKFSYISIRNLPPFFQEKHRIVWSKIELVDEFDNIEHPVVRAALKYFSVKNGVEIHHQGDLPSRAGLGSSSSFAVGLVNAINVLQNKQLTKKQLADYAVHLEKHLLNEKVGIQDQIAAAFGGLNYVKIKTTGDYEVTPVNLTDGKLDELQNRCILVYTGVSRFASDIASSQIKNIPLHEKALFRLKGIADEGYKVFAEGNIEDIGPLLDESWNLKKNLASGLAPTFVDDLYDLAINNGATGGKLLGAGGGGFMLFIFSPKKKQQLLDALSDFIVVPFKISFQGSEVLYTYPDGFSSTSITRDNFVKVDASLKI